jgi:hypothetical protein
VKADKNSAAVGVTIVLTLEYRLSGAGSPVVQWPDSIPHLEWVEKHPYKKLDRGKQKWLVQEMQLTSYDTGKWVLPPVIVIDGGKKWQSSTTSLQFHYSEDSHASNYHDIKDIEAVPAPESSWYYWISALFILLTGLFIFHKNRKKPVVNIQVSIPQKITAYEQATQELDLLKRQLKSKHPEMKQFYTQLVDVFRKFIRDRKQFSSMEKTNGELIAYLKTCSLPDDQLRQLVRQLELADEVKFALYQPKIEEAEKSFFLIELAIKYMNS